MTRKPKPRNRRARIRMHDTNIGRHQVLVEVVCPRCGTCLLEIALNTHVGPIPPAQGYQSNEPKVISVGCSDRTLDALVAAGVPLSRNDRGNPELILRNLTTWPVDACCAGDMEVSTADILNGINRAKVFMERWRVKAHPVGSGRG